MRVLTWMDGRLVPESEAVVPFLTAGLHYGMGVFEGIRCYETAGGPAVFRLGDHLARLVDSARILGFGPLPYDVAALTAAVHETVTANNLRACYIRPLIFLADGGMNLSIDTGRPRVGIAAWAWHDYHGETANAGIRVSVSSYTRHHPNVMPTHAKVSGNYVNSFLAKTEASRLGFDDAVMLSPDGFVAEATGANLFLVRRGVIYTTPLDSVLCGITRDTVLTLARDLSLPVVEERIVRDRLYTADELFLCGTAAEVVGIREVDMRTVGAGAVGPLTAAIQREFRQVVSGEHARSAEWFSPVPDDRSVPDRIESHSGAPG